MGNPNINPKMIEKLVTPLAEPPYVFDEQSLDQLRLSDAYPHPVDDVLLRETHISWILLTGKFAYKIKKPVNFEFVDFSTLEKRRFFCAEELRLNRRFAADIYLDVVPITLFDGRLSLDGEVGQVVEYAVKMRQFDERDMLQSIAAEGRFSHDLARRLGACIANIHQSFPRCKRNQWPETTTAGSAPICAAMAQNFAGIRPRLRSENERRKLSGIEAWYRDWHRLLTPFLERRLDQGFVRDCHGDLHLGNITLIDGEVTLFDCIEFNCDFRRLDVICELAFLTMDLDRYELPSQANLVLNAYLEASGDYLGLHALDYYRVYAALVRAKVALLRECDSHSSSAALPQDYHRYIELALRYCRRGLDEPGLFLMSGVSGSGKSTVAELVAEQTGGIRIRSDVERKRILGRGTNPLGFTVQPAGAAYSTEVTRQTYARLQEIALCSIEAGFTCIVDATFGEASWRAEFLRLAEQLERPLTVVYCHTDIDELESRIRQRGDCGNDPSEATTEVLHQQLEHFEFPAADEGFACLSIDTGQANWQQQVIDALDD